MNESGHALSFSLVEARGKRAEAAAKRAKILRVSCFTRPRPFACNAASSISISAVCFSSFACMAFPSSVILTCNAISSAGPGFAAYRLPFFACHHLLRLQLGRSLHALLVVVAQVASLQSLYKSIYVSHVFSQHITIPRYAHRRDSRHGRGRVKMPRSHSNDRNGRGRVNQLTRRIVGPLGSCFSLLPLASGLYDESAWPDLVLMRHQFDV